MKFENSREWLARKLAEIDDTNVAAGGTDFEQLRKDAESRTVTPNVLAEIPTEIGRAVRYIREQHGWSRREMADLAAIDEIEITSVETVVDYQPTPRALMRLADICGFSRRRFQELAKHVVLFDKDAANDEQILFAAKSRNLGTISGEEFDAVRALVQVLSEKASDEK